MDEGEPLSASNRRRPSIDPPVFNVSALHAVAHACTFSRELAAAHNAACKYLSDDTTSDHHFAAHSVKICLYHNRSKTLAAAAAAAFIGGLTPAPTAQTLSSLHLTFVAHHERRPSSSHKASM
jgi:hypothetical protein